MISFRILLGEQNVIHMVGKDSLFQDYLWSIAYYLILQPDGGIEYMFPSFYDHVVDPNSKKYDSQIAQAFSRCLKVIIEISKKYCSEDVQIQIKESMDEFSIENLQGKGNLKAHGCKKLGIQTLGDLLTISIQDISMQGGWELKSFNTFFDYWVGSLPASVRSGKMIAGWRQVLGQGYHGGAPPTLEDITSEVEKVDKFVESLLGHHLHLKDNLKKLFVANILRHWKESVETIQKEPLGRYEGEKYCTHPFIANIEKARIYSNVSIETFNGWVESVRHGFIRRNIISMAKADCEEVGYGNISIDGRSFLEVTESNSKQ